MPIAESQNSSPPSPSPSSIESAVPPRQEFVHLRAATEADAEALALVAAATFLEAYTWMIPGADMVAYCTEHATAEAYRKYLAQPATRITLAVTGADAPVGYAMLTAPELPSFDVQPSDIELKRIYLFSRFRSAATPVIDTAGKPIAGLRAGQALMSAAVQEAQALGRHRMLLGTHAGNLQAIAFYRRNGFVEVGTRTFQVGTQCCRDLIFGKELG